MRFDVLTLFPDMFEAVLGTSIIGRARDVGSIEMEFTNIRDYSQDKHKRVDDYPYGGGAGMVMAAPPIYDAWKAVCERSEIEPFTIFMSPQGRVLDQGLAKELAEKQHLVIICGHYEGIDERVVQEIADMEVSLGDFVLTGGEIPAMALVDCVARMIPGVLAEEEGYVDESHFNGLLEYPQYTRPSEWRGRGVPEVLLSGHHSNILKWRRIQALFRTWLKRPDMLKSADLDKKDREFLQGLKGKRRKGKKSIY